MKHRQDRLSRTGKRMMMVLLPVFVAVMVIVHIIQSAPSARLAGLSEDRGTSGSPSCISGRKAASTDAQGPLPALISKIECPPNTMFGQTPHGPDDDWRAYSSEQSWGWLTYENFSGVGESICRIGWWGHTWQWSGFWSLCSKEVDYVIRFYTDRVGEPGDQVASRVVHPTPTFTGTYLTSDAGDSPLWYFEAAINPSVDLSEGWISIEGGEDQGNPNCGFLWMSSGDGDGKCYQNDLSKDRDLALCLAYSYEGEKGDVNIDGSVNVLDMLRIANHILRIVYLDEQELWRADLNGPVGNCDGDGNANVLDMVKIANIIMHTDSCSTDEHVQKIEDNLADQLDYLDQFTALAAVMDTNAAMDSMVALISQNPDVEWAANVITGINIQWASGLRGGFAVRLQLEGSGEHLQDNSQAETKTESRLGGQSPVTPASKKTIYLAPCYSAFLHWDDTNIKRVDEGLAKTGYDALEVKPDGHCTLNLIRNLSDYGVVIISSYGVPWPSLTDISDVYFMSGEEVTRQTIIDNWIFLENQFLGIFALPGTTGRNRLCVSSPYFASFNDFEDNHPYVSLLFYFGFQGHWPTDLVNNAEAAAVTGWDWAPTERRMQDMTWWFFNYMCDKKKTPPPKIEQWYALVSSDLSYHDAQFDRDVHFLYAGEADFTMFEGMLITSITPSSAEPGTEVTIEGKNFGPVKGTVMFGAVSASASDIPVWTDTRIETKVPDEAPLGDVLVFVHTDTDTSNKVPFKVGIDLVPMLLTCDRFGGHIKAPHVFTSGTPDFEIFDQSFSSLVWNGTSFSREGVFGGSTFSLSGSVSTDGRRLSLSWVTSTMTTYDGERPQSYYTEAATIDTLPFDYYVIVPYFGNLSILYSATGPSVAQYVSHLSFSYEEWDYDGNSTGTNQYLYTNWQAPADTIELKCGFSRD